MKRLGFYGLALFALAALIQFPAAWLAAWMESATGQRWRLGGVEGTVWRGSATLSGLDRSSGRWHAGIRVHWSLVWSELLRGRATVQVGLDERGGATASAAFTGWSFRRLEVALPAGTVTALLPGTLSQYGWSGTLNARGGDFGCRWSRAACAGQIELTWANAAVARLPGPALGDFRLRVTAEGDILRIDVGTLRGRLQIAGTGELTTTALRFSGEAEARGEDTAGLNTVLRTVGRPGSAPGRYLIEYREQLRR